MTTPRRKTRFDRMISIPLIGLGSAICATTDYVQTNHAEFAAMPGLAGAFTALLGVFLLRRSIRATSNAVADEAEAGTRIAPYVPETSDGSDGARALNRVLTPTGRDPSRPVEPRPLTAVRVQRTRRDSVRLAHAEPVHDVPRRAAPSKALCAAFKLGNEWSKELKLSRRAMAQLEADPFVQRLGKLT